MFNNNLGRLSCVPHYWEWGLKLSPIRSLSLVSVTVWPQFQCQVMVPPIRPPFGGEGGYGWPRRGWGSKMAPVEISCPHSDSNYVHTICLSCTVGRQYTTRQTDRQSDRNRRKRRIVAFRLTMGKLVNALPAAPVYSHFCAVFCCILQPTGSSKWRMPSRFVRLIVPNETVIFALCDGQRTTNDNDDTGRWTL